MRIWPTAALVLLGVCARAHASPPDTPDDIIVIGEKVPVAARDVASSVAVFTQESIAATASDRAEQLFDLIPNLLVASGGLGPTIRGQDSTGVLRDLSAFLGGTRPRVTVQVDGRGVSYWEFVFGAQPLWDVAQVEVWRSPQTTTHGRNSIAGAIIVSSRDPTFEWEAAARGILGQLDTRQVSAMVSGPVVGDQLAVRIAADHRQSRPASEIAELLPGAVANEDFYGQVRVRALAQPKGLAGARIEATYTHHQSSAPAAEGIRPPYEERRDPLAITGIFSTNIESGAVEWQQALGNSAHLSATFTHGSGDIRRYGPPGLGQLQNRISDTSAEAILSGGLPGPLTYVAGIFYLTSEQDQRINLTAAGLGIGTFHDLQTSLGLFGQIGWSPAPNLELTAGLRRQQDRQERSGALAAPSRPIPLLFVGNFIQWLPRFTLAWDMNERVRTGLLVQRAANPGGASLIVDTGELDTFAAETLWSAEGFLRARSADGRLTVSANMFATLMHDAQRPQQRTILRPGLGTVTITEVSNAPRARTLGIEMEATLKPSRHLKFDVALGLLDTRILETVEPTDPILGKAFQRAPPYTATLGVDWRPDEATRLSAQLRTRGGYWGDDRNSPNQRVSGTTLLDARAERRIGPFSLFAYGRNLFDRFYFTSVGPTSFATAGDPRELGFGIEGRF